MAAGFDHARSHACAQIVLSGDIRLLKSILSWNFHCTAGWPRLSGGTDTALHRTLSNVSDFKVQMDGALREIVGTVWVFLR